VLPWRVVDELELVADVYILPRDTAKIIKSLICNLILLKKHNSSTASDWVANFAKAVNYLS